MEAKNESETETELGTEREMIQRQGRGEDGV